MIIDIIIGPISNEDIRAVGWTPFAKPLSEKEDCSFLGQQQQWYALLVRILATHTFAERAETRGRISLL